MARVKDLWFKTVKGPDGNPTRVPTVRHGHGKRWLACWTGPTGRETTKAFARKQEAADHSNAMEADRLRGVYVDAREGRVKLQEYGKTKWLPAQVHLREGSTDTYDTHLRSRIYPALGDRRMNGITRSDMKAFVSGLASDLKPSTVHTVFAVIRSLMQSAVDDGVIPANPCSRVPLPRIEPRVVEPLPVSAVLALVETITPRYKLAVWLAAGLGLREGEALGLTVSKVDFLRRRVHIHRQMQKGILSPLKTKASKRTVPADDLVLTEITAHMQKFTPGSHEVLITNRCRRPVKRSSFWSCWADAVEGAGLPKGTRFHDLRHFYASSLIRANLNPKVIQSRLGHATISETMDTYGHLFPDDEDLGRGAIESMIIPALPEQQRNREAT
ncbi:tyrosine-type recombinase/integrase [Streptosporangium sp. NPDC006007]|uniref:tyrosine-type recombinase/integrase n=1 Tax=Streptosporangium sp. NPDC006007 TaxID=3154575 RepID=UPI0033AB75F8